MTSTRHKVSNTNTDGHQWFTGGPTTASWHKLDWNTRDHLLELMAFSTIGKHDDSYVQYRAAARG